MMPAFRNAVCYPLFVVLRQNLRTGSLNQQRKMLGCRRERMLELVEEARVKISRSLFLK